MLNGFVIVLAITFLLLGWLYSWTFAAAGRIGFFPAAICRLGSLASQFGGRTTYSEAERESANAFARRMMQLPDVPCVTVQDEAIRLADRTIMARWYIPPSAQNCPVVLNIHGGAWWMGNDFIDDAIMKQLCVQSGAIVLSIDYRLSPEHVFPAALEDCYEGLLWLSSQAAAHGGNPEKLAVHGTSAGGGLASALCQLSRERSGPQIRYQVLVVPVTDVSGVHAGDSMLQFGSGYVLTEVDLEEMIGNYLGADTDPKNPLVSPVFAPHLSDLPPALILLAEFDPLRDQGEAFGSLLSNAGVAVKQRRYSGVVHGFFGSKKTLMESVSETASELSAVL